MKASFSLVALALIAVVIVVGCTPRAEADSPGLGTTGGSNKLEDKASSAPTETPSGKVDDDDPGKPDDDGKADDEDEAGEVERKDDDTKTTAVSAPTKTGSGEMKVAAFRDAEGKLLCPVMGVTIESEEKAIGFQDFKGVRYYFCCGDCPKLFKKDPDSWLKK